MDDEVSAYIDYVSNLGEVVRPQIPKFRYSAYSDSEYKNAIFEVMKDYENVDDFDITIKHLKGE